MSRQQRFVTRRWGAILDAMGFELIRSVSASNPTAIWNNIRAGIEMADGAVILALRQLRVDAGSWRPETSREAEPAIWWPSPWTYAEVGMACMSRIPTLIIREDGIGGGPLDPELVATPIFEAVVDATGDDPSVRAWAVEIKSRIGRTRVDLTRAARGLTDG
jgi:hypothetical protein